ncbi:DUF4118 domain-containing protein [Vallicoccus soli]|uniref:histidine kinase n=1 Tax=Vallicoccus soli TaxID=2339232 RepID=A0A3A3Z2A4_9ACTN|nr:DUF4118 domain-containing protein [Vallicoccus soli]RJK97574.1 sensor histidine kinase KdpD [Vallicoccus soli]
MRRGRLRVYLGAAPGVGKTYRMLGEAHRRAERGTDVVVALVETHGRRRTAAMVEGLEVVPRRVVVHRGVELGELDVDAVLARRPEVALVDELAHTNAPGSRHEKRWQDVEDLLAAGIDVISTVNIQHLASLTDVVASITGVRQQETVPDEVVRRADQVELVDMTPEALRRRLAHGNVYAGETVDAALAQWFRPGNLTALRELALLWLADRVDDALEAYRAERGIAATWPARERVVVALTGGPEGETLVRRAARIARRGAGGELLAVHVVRDDGIAGAAPGALAAQRRLVEELGGSFHAVVGDDVADAVLDFARGVNASLLVLGVSRRRRLSVALRPGAGERVIQGSGAMDVHVVTHERAGSRRRRAPRRDPLGRRRRVAGWVLALAGPAALAAVLLATQDLHSLPTELMLFLTLTVVVALVGGLWPAVAGAVVGSLLVNFLFTPPVRTWTVADPENAFALGVFVAVAVAVASVVDLAARRSAQASRARAEAETLSLLAGSVLRGEVGVDAVLARLRETFAVRSVSLLERDDERSPWRCVRSSGAGPCAAPEEGDAEIVVSPRLALALQGRVLAAGDRRVLEAFAAHAATALERERLAADAARAQELEEGNSIRSALLAAVSHDLRTPLATSRAAVSSLLQQDVAFSPEDERALLSTVDEATSRLERLIDDLLDVSRIEADAVRVRLRPASLDEVLPGALAAVPPGAVEVDAPEDLPLVSTDPGLVERALANVVENAVRHAPRGSRVRVSAAVVPAPGGPVVQVRVVDRGPGVPDEDKPAMFRPFQRLGDAPAGAGTGLGLAVARGFLDAVGARVAAEDTPGGGLTMVVDLPLDGAGAPAAAGAGA